MKFLLVDRIEKIEPEKRIVTIKNLTLAEEYLADHFASFPVLPGVLMLEAMTQSAAWLVRLKHNFAHSIVVLKAARNVRYNYFLKPGNTLRCELEAVEIGATTATFKGAGYVGDRLTVSARLELECRNMAQEVSWGREIDQRILQQIRREFELLGGPKALADAGA